MFRRLFVFLFVVIFFGGCAVMVPLPKQTTLKERLLSFPTKNLELNSTVEIYWDEHAIPFITAKSDEDLAFSLGLVHAHLRLAQMEFFRLASQGRLSEVGSVFAHDVDKLLRTIDFTKATKKIYEKMDSTTKIWLSRYVEGINSYIKNQNVPPHEFEVMGLQKTKWSVEDIVAIGRLAGTDINWLVWYPFLNMPDSKEKDELWQRLKRIGADSMPSFRASLPSFKGSNSIAISKDRSKNGSAILANDPHLGISIPNIWLIVGLKSPTLHAVGLTMPGLPFIGVGRNEHIAWGGTNMRAQSSELFFVPNGANIRLKSETIKTRWWQDETWEKKELDVGSLINNIPQLKDAKLPNIGMRWLGHDVSDEFGAFLRVNRAKNWDEFVNAFEGYALSGQNMLYADKSGNIGQLMAVKLPKRGEIGESLIREKSEVDRDWSSFYEAASLPKVLNPKEGVLASSNNKPTDASIYISNFFSPNDRVWRINELLSKYDKIGLDELKNIQKDTFSPSSFELKNLLCQKLNAKQSESAETLCSWDGKYGIDSKGALMFQLVLFELKQSVYAQKYANAINSRIVDGTNLIALLKSDIQTIEKQKIEEAIEKTQSKYAKYGTWGGMHKLSVSHQFSNIPLVGGKYVFMELPIDGSNETVSKSAHAITDKKHNTSYGTNARHISQMDDVDENYFVLLGGQDGWVWSENFLDQIEIFLGGGYIKVPLNMESVKQNAKYKTILGDKSR